MNEILVFQKLLNKSYKTQNELESILEKVQQLNYFNQFVLKYFDGLSRDSKLNLCGCLRMEHFKGSQSIFIEGDVSNDKLYIVYAGQVGVLRAKKFETFVENEKTRPIRRLSSLIKKIPKYKGKSTSNPLATITQTKHFAKLMLSKVTIHQTHENEAISEEEELKVIEKYGEIVKVYQRGEGFGELALLQNTPRMLSAVTVTQDAFLIILHKEEFQVVQTSFQQQMKEKKSLIFSKFQVQNDYSTALLQSLAYSFKIDTFIHKQYLCVQGQPQKYFYLIQNGEVMMERDGVKVCIVGKGQFVGEDIVFNQDNISDCTSIVVSSSATLMVISKSEFIQKFPEECRRMLKAEYQTKKQHRYQFHSISKEVKSPQPLESTPRNEIEIKINNKTLRSQKHKHLPSQDIGMIVKKYSEIYYTKYSEHVHRSNNSEAMLLVTPQTSFKSITLPTYPKMDDVLSRSIKQTLKKTYKRNLMLNSPSSSLVSSYQDIPLSSVHKRTYNSEQQLIMKFDFIQ